MNDYLLIDGTQIPVTSELAQVVGLNEAIVLQEVFYWCKVNRREKRPPHDGYYWVYNSYREWKENHFPWWSISTIRRTFERLEARNLLVAGNYNKSKMDQTKWYRVNFSVLASTIKSSPFAQNEPMDLSGLSKPIPDIIPDRNENGAFTPQAAKSTRAVSAESDSNEIDIPAFIDWYYALYMEIRGEEHPNIKPQQRTRVIDELSKFLTTDNGVGVDTDGLHAMAEDFFYTADSNDWRINHFATPGVLEMRYYNVYMH